MTHDVLFHSNDQNRSEVAFDQLRGNSSRICHSNSGKKSSTKRQGKGRFQRPGQQVFGKQI